MLSLYISISTFPLHKQQSDFPAIENASLAVNTLERNKYSYFAWAPAAPASIPSMASM